MWSCIHLPAWTKNHTYIIYNLQPCLPKISSHTDTLTTPYNPLYIYTYIIHNHQPESHKIPCTHIHFKQPYIYIYIYIYIYTHTHIYIHTYTHTYIIHNYQPHHMQHHTHTYNQQLYIPHLIGLWRFFPRHESQATIFTTWNQPVPIGTPTGTIN